MRAESLAAYLDHYVFAEAVGSTEQPDPDAVKGFETFIASYKTGTWCRTESCRDNVRCYISPGWKVRE